MSSKCVTALPYCYVNEASIWVIINLSVWHPIGIQYSKGRCNCRTLMQYQCGSPAVLKLCHITVSLALEAPRPALCSPHSTFSLFKHKVLWHTALHQLPLLPFTTTCIYIWAHSAICGHFSSTICKKDITSRNWLVLEQPLKVPLRQSGEGPDKPELHPWTRLHSTFSQVNTECY